MLVEIVDEPAPMLVRQPQHQVHPAAAPHLLRQCMQVPLEVLEAHQHVARILEHVRLYRPLEDGGPEPLPQRPVAGRRGLRGAPQEAPLVVGEAPGRVEPGHVLEVRDGRGRAIRHLLATRPQTLHQQLSGTLGLLEPEPGSVQKTPNEPLAGRDIRREGGHLLVLAPLAQGFPGLVSHQQQCILQRSHGRKRRAHDDVAARHGRPEVSGPKVGGAGEGTREGPGAGDVHSHGPVHGGVERQVPVQLLGHGPPDKWTHARGFARDVGAEQGEVAQQGASVLPLARRDAATQHVGEAETGAALWDGARRPGATQGVEGVAQDADLPLLGGACVLQQLP
mmetsp:Transcript_5101/g.19102  ORF Transcript_5101/g.19102 Transcript_5101/m.19102 type:complete len:337 (+) Transcript_5101:1444-2454(+)